MSEPFEAHCSNCGQQMLVSFGAATPSEEATEPALVLVRYGTGGVFLDGTTNAAIDYSAATPSGGPLDVERLAEVINDLDLVLRPDLLAQTIAAEYERLTRE